MLKHLVDANNKLLRMCYNLKSDDNGQNIGLSPRLSTLELSPQRNSDVINIDEEELISLIQQCAKPRVKYGQENKLNVNSFNLRLLETQLTQKYIIGRKFLKYDRIIFEFAGQRNIPQEINNINRKWRNATKSVQSYFAKNETGIEQDLRLLSACIDANRQHIANVDDADDDNDDSKRNEKESKMRGYKNVKEAVEQTIIAISRMDNYPHPEANLLWKYMKKTLHLYPRDYKPFQQTQLKLRHINVVWRYLEKQKILCEGEWTEIPYNIMNCYLKPISERQKTNMKQFIVSKDIDKGWIFLNAMRRWMVKMCKTKLAEPDELKLKDTLQVVEYIDAEMCRDIPNDLTLAHIGYSYKTAAATYQCLLNEVNQ